MTDERSAAECADSLDSTISSAMGLVGDYVDAKAAGRLRFDERLGA